MTTDPLPGVLSDLAAESDALELLVCDLGDWSRLTTPEGWTVAHQIAHLTWSDAAALTAIECPEEFASMVGAATQDPGGFVDDGAASFASSATADLLHQWRTGRERLSTALGRLAPGTRIAWYGPPMSAASMATARLMETWAHGHDVSEALGITMEPTERAKHVARLGVRTRDYAYRARGETPPPEPFRVELRGVETPLWSWGPPEAAERVTGSGYDFALLATRRRHRDDVDVHAEGANAQHWLTIVQAFAGLPGNDPQPRQERTR